MKRSFFQAAIVLILLYGCTTWTLTKRMEKKLDGNYTRMLQAILYKSWGQSTSCTATYLLSRKLSKLDKQDMQDTAGEAVTSSQVMFSYGPSHMAEQKQTQNIAVEYLILYSQYPFWSRNLILTFYNWVAVA